MQKHDPDWEYDCTVRDINVHDGSVYLVVHNPQHLWQERGLNLARQHSLPNVQVGDRVLVRWLSTAYSGYYAMDHIITKAENPGKPSFEIVDQGRWYDKYLCCSKADISREPCVCSCITKCPVHGNAHHGTHD